jgi:hypothetical protein
MGKRAKEHRKKVAARNQKIKSTEARIQKIWQEEFARAMEEARKNNNVEDGGLKAKLSDVE